MLYISNKTYIKVNSMKPVQVKVTASPCHPHTVLSAAQSTPHTLHMFVDFRCSTLPVEVTVVCVLNERTLENKENQRRSRLQVIHESIM